MSALQPLDRRKILLVHPLGYSAGSAGNDISRKANVMPPLGLASISAWLDSKGFSTTIADYFARPGSDKTVQDYLRTERPAFIGFSCTTSSFLDGARIAAMAKAELPGVTTIFGGAHVSALRERVLAEFPAVDMVVVGEGEETMREIMERGLDDPASIPGLVWRDTSGTPTFNGRREHLLDLDALPFPAYEKLDGFPHDYTLPIFNYPRAPNTSCSSSRGCPYACSYCDRSVFGRSYRFNSAQYLYEHLRHLRDRFGIRHVNFYDDQFTFHKKRVEEFTDMLVAKPLGMTFNCAVRANHIDEDLIRRLKAAGCWMTSLGIETGDQALLERQNRKIDLGDLGEKIKLVKRHGIRVKGLLMMGLPGETEETIAKTKRYVFSLPVDDLNMTKFTPFPGSPIYDEIKAANGQLGEFDEDWQRMDCMHFLFVAKGMTRERLDELHRDFYKSHFTRPKVLWDYVTMLWRSPQSWMRFLANLRSFWSFAHSSNRYGKA
ncbi:B12-binding domain-containing radical SAM protein [Desulfocurvibacter africanus]|uniref:B12-binding domain-containing radical SAM protein n=1 Tax=Desulfocurvibacter africanus TaxID=873 RepID=UPI00040F64AB|nr:radical SAM protein [Desulfocurvibacter africanus]